MVYATKEDYLKYYTVVPENFDRFAESASINIDILTFNRIVSTGWENLTDYQRSTIIECTCEIIQFMDDNIDVLDSVLSSYSINGVSMQFKFNPTIFIQNGIVMRQSTYGQLMSTGLCYRGI